MIEEVTYRSFLKKKLEEEIEDKLRQDFERDFKVVISADADILTDAELKPAEKMLIMKTVSTYLLDFDTKSNENNYKK